MNFITIDLAFMNKHKLSSQQAMFFSYLHNSTSWADQIIDEGACWFWLNRNKVVSDIPYVTSKTDTVYRWFVDFSEQGLIAYKKIGNKDVFQLTLKGKTWNNKSDGHPNKVGRSSENNSDGHPTDSINNIDRDNKDNNDDASDVLKQKVEEIVCYLNQVAGTGFMSKNKKTISLIKSRIDDGFDIDDFMKVIDIKAKQWLNNNEMNMYLRPETLFGGHFESYLQEATRATPKKEEYKRYTDKSKNVW